jgi:rubrerythrin
MRLTKLNPETGEYECATKAKTLTEFRAQRKTVIQRLGELEDRDEGHWISQEEAINMDRYDLAYTCSVCGHCDWDSTESENFNYCPNCGAKMKGENDEQR